VTCDNASNNDVMVDKLSELVSEFAGDASHTRCFLHIVNLIAKSLISQFDRKKGSKEVDNEVEALQWELIEETLPDEAGVKVEADNDEGSVDELDELTETEQLAIERSVRPVKLALVKVSENFVDIPDSLMIRLALHSCLQIDPLDHHSASGLARDPEKGWCKCHKYADIATRWNSTYDMLEYALTHWPAIDQVTQQHDLGLRKFELSDEEWVVVQQLHNVLKVSLAFPTCGLCVANWNVLLY